MAAPTTSSVSFPGGLKGWGNGPLPPMLEQYVALRDQYPEYLMLFQVGDFYEAFGEDAERLSRALNITLTHKTSRDFSTSMAGIPIRAADQHVERLLASGVRVAVADQADLPESGLVERRVTQLLTPGTLTDERLLTRDENYLAAIATGDGYALALLDVSTGEFRCATFGTRGALYDELARHQAREVLLAPELEGNAALLADFQARFPVMRSQASFDPEAARGELTRTLGRLPQELGTEALVRACGAALAYARFTQQGHLEMVTRLTRYEPGAQMTLPDTALRALEVFAPNVPGGQTLMAALDLTRTAGGRRRLRGWLRAPLIDAASIAARQDAVQTLVRAPDLLGGARGVLHRTHDLERLAARVTTRRATPREVTALARTLSLLPDLQRLLGGEGGLLASVHARLTALPDAVDLVRAALVDEPPLRQGDGGLIRDGYHEALDTLRRAAHDGRTWMADLEARERQRLGIPVKVGYNSVFGYYLEVTHAHGTSVPPDYRQVATLKDRARYTRPDVREREREIASAEAQAAQLEAQVFAGVRDALARHAEALLNAASALSELDVLCALAQAATDRGWVRPEAAKHVRLRQARHPVVELTLQGAFVPNDADLHDTRRALLLTGPNMAGKSTYLRTVALCALLHQIGSFVPADHAELPLFDAVHTRIGASDDLAGGRSTFMVEMSELASILHAAGERSLVILDEVGRGTSTTDGLAIAWAALEHLHAARAWTLFATHYFELTRLEGELAGLVNLHVAAQEEAGGLVFYHQVVPGAAHSSYGVEVARLAGLPAPVTDRAAHLLRGLSAQGGPHGAALRRLAALDLARVTPMQALELLHDLQRQLTEPHETEPDQHEGP